MTPRLKTIYKDTIVPGLMEKFSYKNIMQVPKIERIVLNMGLGKATDAGRNTKIIEEAVEELGAIVGQRPVITRAKKSIAGFKLREDLPIGCMVTLRGTMMYEFLDRLINLSLPRVRDFKGISHKAFDGNGNYTLGIREHVIFPEVDYSRIQLAKGMNITFVTTSNTDDETKEMLQLFGLPFLKN